MSEDLIKEVMDSSFISAKTKEEYCTQLSEMAAKEQKIKPDAEVPNVSPETGSSTDPAKMATTMGMTVGVLTAIMSVVLSTADFSASFISEIPTASSFEFVKSVLLPVLATIIALSVTGIALMLSRYRKIEREQRARKEGIYRIVSSAKLASDQHKRPISEE